MEQLKLTNIPAGNVAMFACSIAVKASKQSE